MEHCLLVASFNCMVLLPVCPAFGHIKACACSCDDPPHDARGASARGTMREIGRGVYRMPTYLAIHTTLTIVQSHTTPTAQRCDLPGSVQGCTRESPLPANFCKQSHETTQQRHANSQGTTASAQALGTWGSAGCRRAPWHCCSIRPGRARPPLHKAGCAQT